MQLIGMLDSPYVRRVAVSLHALELPFTHRCLSVFRTYDAFKMINPVVKAPTLICDDGTVLVDSTLILEYVETLGASRSLMPRAPNERAAALRTVGLALVACEKTVYTYYERNLRPPEKQYEPWVQRMSEQLRAAYQALETDLAAREARKELDAAVIAVAIAWRFTAEKLPHAAKAVDFPNLAALSTWAETQPPFLASPYDETTVHA